MSNKRRLQLTKIVVVLGLLATFAVSPRLFLTQPYLSPVPVFDNLPLPRPPLDRIILWGLAAALFPILFLRNPRRLILIWCACFVARCLWDRITWQPYLLQYFFMLLSLALVDWHNESDEPERSGAVLNSNRLILVCIYFWSGFSKLNYANMFAEADLVLLPLLNEQWVRPLAALWWLIPFIEIGFAGALLSVRFRALGLALGIVMHVLILAVYGPFGHDYNPVVWPWNVAMICLLLILYRGDNSTPARSIIWPGRQLWKPDLRAARPLVVLHSLVLIFFAICPALSYAGAWSPYLSFRLYSRLYSDGAILLRQPAIDALPVKLQNYVRQTNIQDCDGILYINEWAEDQLNAFPPTDVPVLRCIARRLCQQSTEPGSMKLLIYLPPHALTGKVEHQVIDCEDL